jgi:hypothetical protein
VGVGDDPARRHYEAGPVADRDHALLVAPHDHHPDHAARGRVDIARLGGKRRGGEQQGEGDQDPEHGPAAIAGCAIDRKRRDARRHPVVA